MKQVMQIVFFTTAGIEFVIYHLQCKKYSLKESVISFLNSAVNSLFSGYLVYYLVSQVESESSFGFSLISFRFKICFFIFIDFCYYWIHRINHSTRLFWQMHRTHHYPNSLTILTSSLKSPVSIVFNLHMVLALILNFLGIPITTTLFYFSINLFYQSWLHTELVPKLNILEYIINTPNLHRIHHHCSVRSEGRNFGGVFIVFDILFKTYQKEAEEDLKFGVFPKLYFNSIFDVWVSEYKSWREFFLSFPRRSVRKVLIFILSTPKE